MKLIHNLNLFIDVAGLALALLAFIKTATARHSFNLYVWSGATLVAGAVVRFFVTTNYLAAGVELVVGVCLLIYIYSSRGGIRIR